MVNARATGSPYSALVNVTAFAGEAWLIGLQQAPAFDMSVAVGDDGPALGPGGIPQQPDRSECGDGDAWSPSPPCSRSQEATPAADVP